MSATLAQRQKQLLAYLQGHTAKGQDDICKHIVQQGKVATAQRLGIYQNAYKVRLKETIDTDHQILGRYLGDDLYEQMMNAFIKQCPSQHFSLRHFADPLPDFLNGQAPFNDHPQIAELARFERLLLVAFDARDAKRTPLDTLTQLASDKWPNIKLRFHPSVQLFVSPWNVVHMWQQLKQDQAPPEPVQEKNTWLVWRNHERLTEFRPIDHIAVTMLEMFQRGKNFADVCQALLEYLPEQEVSPSALNILLNWFELGLIQSIKSN